MLEQFKLYISADQLQQGKEWPCLKNVNGCNKILFLHITGVASEHGLGKTTMT